MTAKPVKLAILGYGHYVRTNFIYALKACPSVEIAGVFNRGEDRRQQAEQDGFFATSDLDELLSRPGLEAVLIATSAGHREQAEKAAARGLHILCEKPMATTLEEIDAMVTAAQKAKIVTHVNYPAIYTPAFVKFHELTRAHAGRILHFWERTSRGFGTWVRGGRHGAVAHPEVSGGWTYHHQCHAINSACFLIGSRAVKVYHTEQKSTPEAPSEEIVNSFIHFENGATALISDGTTIGGFADRGVQGTDGDLRLLDTTITLVTHGVPSITDRPGNLGRKVETFGVPAEDKELIQVTNHFSHAVRGNETGQLLPFEFIRDQYRILAALKKSAQTGQAVNVE